MAAEFERPTFVNGQRLTADDLSALVTYAREPLAQHLRAQFVPGVAAGLEVSVDGDAVVVGAGCFVDDYGQLVVVAAEQFARVPADAEDDEPLPVFLSAADIGGSVTTLQEGCGPAAVGRVSEQAELRIGSAGSSRRAPAIVPYGALDRLPGGAISEICVGYVEKHNGTVLVSVRPGFRADYVGLVAGSVSGLGGSLDLQPSRDPRPDALQVTVTDEGVTVHKGVDELFSVSEDGNLMTKGNATIGGMLSPGKGVGPVAISGRASGPIRAPLPAGFTEADVSPTGGYRATVTVTPDLVVAPVNGSIATYAVGSDADRSMTCYVWPDPPGAVRLSPYRYVVTVTPR